MPHAIPPLNALRIFEVAARAASFTDAARELNLTHGAVSRQIQLLENSLGQPLFRKEGQRMVATSHAKAFAREISAAFDHISDASTRYGKLLTRKLIRTVVHEGSLFRKGSFEVAKSALAERSLVAFKHRTKGVL